MLDKEFFRGRLAFIRDGGETKRFHTMPMLTEDKVGHHSFNVAWLVNTLSTHLAQEARYRLVMAALEHDLAEHKTGDMPAPAKREMGIRKVMGDHEATLLEGYGLRYGDSLGNSEARLLKLADAMDGAFHCIGERALGNARVEVAYDNFRSYIKELEPNGPIELEIVSFIDDLWEKYNGLR